MMSELFQQVLAGGVVLAALGYLFKHYYDRHKVKTGCASCRAMQAVQNPRPNKRVAV